MGTVRTVVVDLTPDVAAALTTTLAPILGDDLNGQRRATAIERRLPPIVAIPGHGPRSGQPIVCAAAGDGRYRLRSGRRRRSPPDGGSSRLLLAAGGQGVPVPPVVTTGEMEGRQFLITEWLPGEALPPKLLRDPALAPGRARLMGDCARALASIHAIPLASQLGLVQEDRPGRVPFPPGLGRRTATGAGVRLPVVGSAPSGASGTTRRGPRRFPPRQSAR